MRLWSLHPSYLDTKGLVALWREALLAKAVLEGKTKGYTNHPQLIRFREAEDPIAAINYFLYEVLQESKKRGYRFDASKCNKPKIIKKIAVSDKQIDYELTHLLKKLIIRDKEKQKELLCIDKPEAHPIFYITKGEIELWEKR